MRNFVTYATRFGAFAALALVLIFTAACTSIFGGGSSSNPTAPARTTFVVTPGSLNGTQAMKQAASGNVPDNANPSFDPSSGFTGTVTLKTGGTLDWKATSSISGISFDPDHGTLINSTQDVHVTIPADSCKNGTITFESSDYSDVKKIVHFVCKSSLPTLTITPANAQPCTGDNTSSITCQFNVMSDQPISDLEIAGPDNMSFDPVSMTLDGQTPQQLNVTITPPCTNGTVTFTDNDLSSTKVIKRFPVTCPSISSPTPTTSPTAQPTVQPTGTTGPVPTETPINGTLTLARCPDYGQTGKGNTDKVNITVPSGCVVIIDSVGVNLNSGSVAFENGGVVALSAGTYSGTITDGEAQITIAGQGNSLYCTKSAQINNEANGTHLPLPGYTCA